MGGTYTKTKIALISALVFLIVGVTLLVIGKKQPSPTDPTQIPESEARKKTLDIFGFLFLAVAGVLIVASFAYVYKKNQHEEQEEDRLGKILFEKTFGSLPPFCNNKNPK